MAGYRRARRLAASLGLLAAQAAIALALFVPTVTLIDLAAGRVVHSGQDWGDLVEALVRGATPGDSLGRWLDAGGVFAIATWAGLSVAAGVWLSGALAHLGIRAWVTWAALLALALSVDPLTWPIRSAFGTLVGDPTSYNGPDSREWMARLIPVIPTMLIAGASVPIGRGLAAWRRTSAPRRLGRRRRRLRARLGVHVS